MSKDKKTYRQLSEREIMDYLNGKLEGKRAHEVERYLLENDFDQEAFEGFEQFVEKDLKKDINYLKQRVTARRFDFFSIAASISILFIAGLSLWWFLKSEEPSIKQISYLDSSKHQVEDPKVVEPPQVPEQSPDEETIQEKNEQSKRTTEPGAGGGIGNEIAGSGATDMGSPEDFELGEQANFPEEDVQVAEDLVLSDELVAKEIPEINYLKESVQTEEFTDQTIAEAKDEASKMKETKSSGAEPSAPVSRARSMAFASEKVAAEEVADVDIEGLQPATPGIGMDEYQKYLKEKLDYPIAASRMGIEGSVYVKATISEVGEVLKTEVIKGLGLGCDEEAQRLVKNGPKWVPATRDGQPVESKLIVPVKFLLD